LGELGSTTLATARRIGSPRVSCTVEDVENFEKKFVAQYALASSRRVWAMGLSATAVR
jgi:hypothetical protein